MNAAISKFGWVTKNDGLVTNLLMDGHRGGKLTVPASEYPAFLDAHASDVARGVPSFVVEYPTEPSRPYVDMDIETEAGGTVCVHDILVIVQRAFRATFYVGARLTLLAMVAPPKPLTNGKIKFGLHIVAPHARATRAELIVARTAALEELTVGVTISNAWDDAYDKAVYISSGLRLVGANKFQNCICKAGCGVCKGRRRYDAGRPYAIHSVLDNNGCDDPSMMQHMKLNVALLVKLGSIRCHERLVIAPEPQARTIMKRQRHDGGGISAMGRALCAVVGVLSPEYSAIDVRDVRRLGNGDRVFTLIGMRYCLNISAEHGSSAIYFYLHRDGWLVQRCFCTKYGCVNFRSERIVASQELLRLCGLLSPIGLPLSYSM